VLVCEAAPPRKAPSAYTVIDLDTGEVQTKVTSRMRPCLVDGWPDGWPTKKTGTEETSAVPYKIFLDFAKPTVSLEAGTTLWYKLPYREAAGAALPPYGPDGLPPHQLHLFEGLEGQFLKLGVFQHVAGMSAVTVTTITMTVELDGNVVQSTAEAEIQLKLLLREQSSRSSRTAKPPLR
jgi:hypothetical protein